MSEPLPVPLDLLTNCLREVLDERVDLRAWSSLGGGTRKTVDRLDTSAGPVVLLTWGNRPDFFGEQAAGDPDREALFYVTNTRFLLENGVRAPRVLYYDNAHTGALCPYALVEYVAGLTFHQALQAGQSAHVLLTGMRATLERMHRLRREYPGILLDTAGPLPCHEDAYRNALEELNDLANELSQIQTHHAALAGRLASLRQEIRSRQEFAFIHGEIGPDEHILVEPSGEVVLLDVDNCIFHDLEREHAYLRLRFGAHYAGFTRPDLDPQRMQFYALCLHISSAWGHRRLYTQGYPDPDRLRSIYEWNAARAIEKAGSG